MDPTLLAMLSIFGGAALTACAALVGASIQASREHQRWIREQRMAAYERVHQLVERMRYGDYDRRVVEDLRRDLNELADSAHISGADRESLIKRGLAAVGGERQTPRAQFDWSREILLRKIEASASLALVGTAEVHRHLEDVFGALVKKDWRAYSASLAALEQAMRESLKIRV